MAGPVNAEAAADVKPIDGEYPLLTSRAHGKRACLPSSRASCSSEAYPYSPTGRLGCTNDLGHGLLIREDVDP